MPLPVAACAARLHPQLQHAPHGSILTLLAPDDHRIVGMENLFAALQPFRHHLDFLGRPRSGHSRPACRLRLKSPAVSMQQDVLEEIHGVVSANSKRPGTRCAEGGQTHRARAEGRGLPGSRRQNSPAQSSAKNGALTVED